MSLTVPERRARRKELRNRYTVLVASDAMLNDETREVIPFARFDECEGPGALDDLKFGVRVWPSFKLRPIWDEMRSSHGVAWAPGRASVVKAPNGAQLRNLWRSGDPSEPPAALVPFLHEPLPRAGLSKNERRDGPRRRAA